MTIKIAAPTVQDVKAKVPERGKFKVDAETSQDVKAKVPERTTFTLGG